jgi:hypothetical protein
MVVATLAFLTVVMHKFLSSQGPEIVISTERPASLRGPITTSAAENILPIYSLHKPVPVASHSHNPWPKSIVSGQAVANQEKEKIVELTDPVKSVTELEETQPDPEKIEQEAIVKPYTPPLLEIPDSSRSEAVEMHDPPSLDQANREQIESVPNEESNADPNVVAALPNEESHADPNVVAALPNEESHADPNVVAALPNEESHADPNVVAALPNEESHADPNVVAALPNEESHADPNVVAALPNEESHADPNVVAALPNEESHADPNVVAALPNEESHADPNVVAALPNEESHADPNVVAALPNEESHADPNVVAALPNEVRLKAVASETKTLTPGYPTGYLYNCYPSFSSRVDLAQSMWLWLTAERGVVVDPRGHVGQWIDQSRRNLGRNFFSLPPTRLVQANRSDIAFLSLS